MCCLSHPVCVFIMEALAGYYGCLVYSFQNEYTCGQGKSKRTFATRKSSVLTFLFHLKGHKYLEIKYVHILKECIPKKSEECKKYFFFNSLNQ